MKQAQAEQGWQLLCKIHQHEQAIEIIRKQRYRLPFWSEFVDTGVSLSADPWDSCTGEWVRQLEAELVGLRATLEAI